MKSFADEEVLATTFAAFDAAWDAASVTDGAMVTDHWKKHELQNSERGKKTIRCTEGNWVSMENRSGG